MPNPLRWVPTMQPKYVWLNKGLTHFFLGVRAPATLPTLPTRTPWCLREAVHAVGPHDRGSRASPSSTTAAESTYQPTREGEELLCLFPYPAVVGTPGEYYSKTVLGCKENRRYEMGVQKIVFRGRRPRKGIF